MRQFIHRGLVILMCVCFVLAERVRSDTLPEDNPTSADTALKRQTIEAIRLTNPISVDGVLSEPEWQRPGISKFTQHDPREGEEPTEKTEFWVAYDDAALYVAARMYDSHPDSIVARMGRRDADINSDWLYVAVDSYHDRRTGFYFGVYASGSITDGVLYNDSWDDNSWDGVWDAATNIDGKGWSAEMRIPFSQLRFPEQSEYVWGINVARQIERSKERDDFVLVPKTESGWVSRFADLTGLRDIKPPRKLELLPYFVSKSKLTNQFQSGDPFHKSANLSGNMGADLKLGLGSNLTLSATINPDFGQVEVDPAVVNLSQFETFFEEKRPFFIEGSNFFGFGYGGTNSNYGFNWGNPDYFYSRRIGRPPQGSTQHSGYSDIPDGTTILAAGKLTGKVAEGWSLATLHAFTQREYAQIENPITHNRYADVVEPFASYNVIRSQKEFNEGRQAIGVIGTAVLRDLNQPYLVDKFNSRSYALGVDGWTNLDKDQDYVVAGWFSTTRIEGTSDRILALQTAPLHYFQRPDAGHVHIDAGATSLSGYAGRVAINKQKGNVTFNTALGIISPGFDSNDLGFLFRTDIINWHVTGGYNWFQPDGLFRRKGFNVATFRSFDFGGHKIGEGYFLFYNAQLMSYWSFNGNLNFSPAVLENRTTRGGPMMATTNGYSGNIYMRTDGRESMVFDLGMYGSRNESGSYYVGYEPSAEWKPTSGVSVRLSPSISRSISIAQWVTANPDPSATSTYGSRYVFARLDQRELSANIRLDWTFTPKLSLQLFLQPLISVGHYDQFKELKQPGTYTFNRFGEDNGSTIYQADHDFKTVLDPNNPTDTTQIYQGEYVVDADGGVGPSIPFTISDPDFNFKSLRGNAVLRWEYLPGSTLFFVWTHGGTSSANPGDYHFGRDVHDLIHPSDLEDVLMIKIAYWWNP